MAFLNRNMHYAESTQLNPELNIESAYGTSRRHNWLVIVVHVGVGAEAAILVLEFGVPRCRG